MRLDTFIERRAQHESADAAFNRKIAWAAVITFVLFTLAALLVPLQHRWLASIGIAIALASIVAVSSLRTSRINKTTTLRCPSCGSALLGLRADIVVSSGTCPNCGKRVFEPAKRGDA